MRLLAIDVGTGTQDILLFDSATEVENCVKMVLPSATSQVARRVKRATAQGRPLVLSGVLMGGGPGGWAIEEHLRAGYRVYATPEAAQTLNDDLDYVQSLGVTLVSQDEARRLNGDAERIQMRDLDLRAVEMALAPFDVSLAGLDGLAVAVLDHGAAPPDVSDRLFRFDHLRRTVERCNSLLAFAYLAEEVPPYLTRMRAVARTVERDLPFSWKGQPTVLLDTGAAGALGALQDPLVAAHEERLIVNLGNMHTLATLLRGEALEGLFEHHTGEVKVPQLEGFLERLMAGTLTHEEIFSSMGHGAYYVTRAERRPFLVATGPRRRLLGGSALAPHFSAPHGDMMLTGCFGLVRAFGERLPQWREEILRALGNGL